MLVLAAAETGGDVGVVGEVGDGGVGVFVSVEKAVTGLCRHGLLARVHGLMGLLRVLEADAQVHFVLLLLHIHLLCHHLHHRHVRAHASGAARLTIGCVLLLLRLTDSNAREIVACTSTANSCSSDALV